MIDFDFVVGVNVGICESENKSSIIINESNIHSALGIQQWYESLPERASAVLRSLVIGHGFQDANKRTAVVVAYEICPIKCSERVIEDCVIKVATGELRDVAEIAQILYSDQI